MAGKKGVKLKPFHESITEIIKTSDPASFPLLAVVLKSTKIPKNHDAISRAWTRRLKKAGWIKPWNKDDLGVAESLMRQKAAVEAEVAARESAEKALMDSF